jgi:RNA polymerase sigma factor (sigma-70 family)
MSTHLVFNGIDGAVKAPLETYWEKKVRRLQKLLVPYRTDLQDIRLTVSHHPHNSGRRWYETRAVIHLPTGTLVAEASDKDPQVTLDRVADALVTEIKRHKERVRHDYTYKRKLRNRADLSAAGPMLEQDVVGGRRDDFFRLLRPHLRLLRDHARRELRVRELNGTLHRGEVTADDLLDEVLTLAWQRFSSRPQRLSLDLWLTNLLHDALEQLVTQEPRKHASLEERVDETKSDAVPQVEQEWWAALLGEQETFTLGDLIPDVKESEAWEQLQAEEQKDRILTLMRDLPPAERQAFLLNVLENYDTAEIAMLQDRPESLVKADIEAVRRMLRERLLAGGDIQEAGELAPASGSAADNRRN